MFLDKLLLSQLSPVGKSLLKKAKLTSYPKNAKEMHLFLETVKTEIEEESFDGLIVGNIFFNFVTSVEVRDRLTTSRIFEDIFSSLFDLKATDIETRSNPTPTPDLIALDGLCTSENWKISEDVSGNKREKSDVHIGEYNISLKTLKGKVYDSHGRITNNSLNREINVGSLSYRALLKGILKDDELATLGDRKKGLGSKKQIRDKVLDVIKEANKQSDFFERLSLFMNYIYDDDVYLVMKSHYKIIFHLIPKTSFRDCILNLYKNHESDFEKVWYRWENNNLRFKWLLILKFMEEFKLPYYTSDILLTKATNSKKILDFTDKINTAVAECIENLASE